MDTTTEEQTAGSAKTMIDETYDFTAPQWYNLENEETKLDEQRSELWFESATSYDSSRTFFSLIHLSYVQGFVVVALSLSLRFT